MTYKEVETIEARRNFLKGLRDGIPICLGYIPISFAFGMEALHAGLSLWVPIAISMTNLTSAGQFAGLSVIVAGGGYVELAVTTFIINLRYMLMSLALSQKLDPAVSLLERCIVAFGNTDEIFAVAMQHPGKLKTSYLIGLIAMPYLGWSAGTILGATATSFLPEFLQSALGITIYAMFLAIIIPPARTSRPIFTAVLIAAGVACLFRYVPVLSGLSSGWVIILAALISAGFCAFRFPVDDEPEEAEGL
jgi:predicted branched-subunit amino acid permease